MRIKLLILILLLISHAQIVMSQEYQVRSPDGDMRMRILANNGKLVYSVSFNRKELISQSLLGLVVNGQD
ncbi:MAG: glycoside hydrolase family 97 N-terminal domain-containing protein, partial [Chitinophagaceae bacterium]